MSSGLPQNIQPGAVIQNRNRLWRVDSIEGQEIVATALGGTAADTHRFYYPIETISEGRLDPPSASRIGNPQYQQLHLQANRLSMLHGTAPLVSLQRSRVIPTEYQLTPVVMALDMPRVRMLLADDVGLGKTIEAGLIISELLARNRAERILIITPANLREQWKDAFNHFFHIDADIISTRHRKAMEKELPPGANPWEHHSKLIASIDYAKQPSIRNQILEQDWDLCIIDEAHNAAKPHQTSADQSIDMQRWNVATDLADHAEHLLLLTATPHNGYSDSFASLLRMLDVGAVSGPQHEPIINRDVAKNHIVQRRRDDVKEWFKNDDEESPFPDRDQDEVYVRPTTYEEEVLDAVRTYGDTLISTARSGSAHGQTLARWSVIHFLKRTLSSPEALRRSLSNRREKLEERLEEADDETIEEDAGISEDIARANALDNDTGEQYTEEEAGERVERVVSGDKTAIEHELDVLNEVAEKAAKVTKTRDSKLQELLKNTLRNRLNTDSRVIIFTKYTDTLEYLAEQVEESGRYDDCDLFTLHGELSEGQRKDRFQEFESSNRAVLISTDVISEGMNLQHACNQIIHYELPWNPNRLEQRNGRIDRYGQPKNVAYIRTMVVEDEMDAAILQTLVKKAEQIRGDYGFSPPYFGDDTGVLAIIEEQGLDAGIPQTTLDEFTQQTPDQGSSNTFDEDTLERIKSDSFYGHTEVDLQDVRERLRETQERMGGENGLHRFVRSALNLFGCPVEMNADSTFNVTITDDRLLAGDVKREYAQVTFDARYAEEHPNVEMLDVAHPLVQRLIEIAKQTAFTDDDRNGRTAAQGSAVVEEETAVYTILARYVAHTEPDPTIMEELVEVALPLLGDEPLEPGVIERITESDAKPVGRAEQEIKADLEEALDRPHLEAAIDNRVSTREAEIEAERASMRERLESVSDSSWLDGIDDVTVGSTDLLAVTLYYPN
ncbi:helicase-related protein [Natrinema gelatinilyticum]|uniref:helicase-related protein n=1 Tax=Natrinema gelatinilyticum TaxID=2961571 RepID=UPI002114D5DA|nr:helicase-related protein [Natrinema gelatinilyticum]